MTTSFGFFGSPYLSFLGIFLEENKGNSNAILDRGRQFYG